MGPDQETKSIGEIQTARRRILFLAVFGLVFVIAFAGPSPLDAQWHEAIEGVGYLLLGAGILGRCWCTLYIGGRKIDTLVETGPYSLCRNPLYFFSFVGAAGIGAQSGSLVITVACVLVSWVVFRLVVAKEERLLGELHGQPYRDYVKATPRFLPDPRRWKDADMIQIRPDRVVNTFLDGLIFLLAIPLAEGFEYLHDLHALPYLFTLP